MLLNIMMNAIIWEVEGIEDIVISGDMNEHVGSIE